MALDTLIKQLFPVLLGGVLAIIAYFQASGVVQLVASKLFGSEDAQVAEGSLRPPSNLARQVNTRKTAQPVIDNNIFDWQVDLDPPPPPPPDAGVEETAERSRLDLSNPLEAERCADVSVRIVTESPDPLWSIAVLQGPGEDKPALRRVGDMVAGFQVAYIGFNRLEASPTVWMTKDAKLCQAFLFAPSEPPPSAASSAPAPTPPPEETSPRRGATSLPSEIADKITKISETEYAVERSVVDHVLENQAELMKSARIVPEKGPDGKTVGIRLFGVRPDTLLGSLGLKNGDRLEGINGFNMASPEEALNAYARLRTAPKLSLTLTRRGQPTTIDININNAGK